MNDQLKRLDQVLGRALDDIADTLEDRDLDPDECLEHVTWLLNRARRILADMEKEKKG